MNENRKQALVTYLAALFGVAFVLVLISLIIQIHQQGDANTTSAERVLALQTQIQQLQEENEQLQDNVDRLRDDILEIQEGTEYLEGIAYDATMRIDYLENQAHAYSCLVTAQEALAEEDEELLYDSMEKLEDFSEYLDSDALEVYNDILEQMGNP